MERLSRIHHKDHKYIAKLKRKNWNSQGSAETRNLKAEAGSRDTMALHRGLRPNHLGAGILILIVIEQHCGLHMVG